MHWYINKFYTILLSRASESEIEKQNFYV